MIKDIWATLFYILALVSLIQYLFFGQDVANLVWTFFLTYSGDRYNK